MDTHGWYKRGQRSILSIQVRVIHSQLQNCPVLENNEPIDRQAKKMQLFNLTCYALSFLMLATCNSAELSRRASRMAEDLGMLLGLPLDIDMPVENPSSAPNFLMNIYDCWTTLGSSESRASCLPVPASTSRDLLEDVNVVRSIKGTAVQASRTGVFSHSPEEIPLPSSLALNFNMSLLRRTKEEIRYAYVHIPKKTLSVNELEYVKNQCNVDAGIQLNLYVKINTTEDSRGVFSLQGSTTLLENDIDQEKSIEFSDITSQFKEWVEENSEFVETRIVVGGDCYNRLNPADLGVGQSTKDGTFIIVFSKSDDSEEAVIKAGLAELAAEATANRQKRSVQNENENSDPALMEYSSSEPRFNISNYHLHPCQRYSHTISFSELGWSEHILRPENYEANFCAGSCAYPLTGRYNTTKHSYIQSLAAELNPNLVPQPCCAPHELRPVTVIYEQAPETFVTHEWHGMRAESCGCK